MPFSNPPGATERFLVARNSPKEFVIPSEAGKAQTDGVTPGRPSCAEQHPASVSGFRAAF